MQKISCPRCKKFKTTNSPFCEHCNFDIFYGTIDKKKKGECLYCDYVGKLSGEHIFPDWLKNEFDRKWSKTRHRLSRPEKQNFIKHTPHFYNDELRSGDPYTITVHNVCDSCNNGWMSKLQNEAKPLVKSLAEGFWPSMNQHEIKILARWCAMVSINFQSFGRIERTDKLQRKKLKNGEMLSGWRVFTGITTSTVHAGHSHYRPISLHKNSSLGDETFTLQSTLFVIENAVFHTLSSASESIINLALESSSVSVNRLPLCPIWPKACPHRHYAQKFDPLKIPSIQDKLIRIDTDQEQE